MSEGQRPSASSLSLDLDLSLSLFLNKTHPSIVHVKLYPQTETTEQASVTVCVLGVSKAHQNNQRTRFCLTDKQLKQQLKQQRNHVYVLFCLRTMGARLPLFFCMLVYTLYAPKQAASTNRGHTCSSTPDTMLHTSQQGKRV